MRTVTANVFSFWSKTEQTEKVGHDHQPPGPRPGAGPAHAGQRTRAGATQMRAWPALLPGGADSLRPMPTSSDAFVFFKPIEERGKGSWAAGPVGPCGQAIMWGDMKLTARTPTRPVSKAILGHSLPVELPDNHSCISDSK